jgi:hypothetical protein
MTRWRCLLVFLAVSGAALLPSLPSADAQRPFGCGPCSGSMQVHTYSIQYKWQQQYMQQQFQQQMVQQRTMQQQARQLYQQQQQKQMVTQARTLQQTQSRALTQTATALQRRPVQIHTASRELHTSSRMIIPQGPRGLHTQPRALVTESRHLTTTSRALHTESRRLTTTARALHTESRKLTTTSRALHMESKQLHTEPRKLFQESRKLVTDSRNLTRQSRWCVETIKVTEITYDQNCGQCHSSKKRTPEPILVNGPRRPMPEPLITPPPRRPTPQPGVIRDPGTPMPKSPTAITLKPPPSPRLPTVIPGPRRPAETPRLKESIALRLYSVRGDFTIRTSEGTPRLKEPIAQHRPPMRTPRSPYEPMADEPGRRFPQRTLGEPMMPGTPGWRPLLSEPLGTPGLPPLPGRLALNEPWCPPLPGEQPGNRTRLTSERYPLGQGTEPGTEPGPAQPRRPGTKGTPKRAPEAVAREDTNRPLPADVLSAPSLPRTKAALREATAEGEAVADPGAQQGQAAQPVRQPLSTDELQAPDLPPLPASILLVPPAEEDNRDVGDLETPDAPELAPRAPDVLARATPASGAPARRVPSRLGAEGSLGEPALPSVRIGLRGPG